MLCECDGVHTACGCENFLHSCSLQRLLAILEYQGSWHFSSNFIEPNTRESNLLANITCNGSKSAIKAEYISDNFGSNSRILNFLGPYFSRTKNQVNLKFEVSSHWGAQLSWQAADPVPLFSAADLRGLKKPNGLSVGHYLSDS